MSCRIALCVTIATLVPSVSTWAADDIRVADERLFVRLDANGDGQLAADELPSNQSRLFARLVRQGDANDDGLLTEDEWNKAIIPSRPAKPIEEKQSSELPGANAARLLLLKLDADGDGVLTTDEAPSELGRVFDRIVEQYDRNEDGRVNRIELSRGGPRLMGMARQAARRLDWNVERELKKFDRQQGEAAMRFSEQPSPRQMLGDPKQALALFQQFDSDGDGKLEKDEVPEQVRDRISRMFRFGDRNRDGVLTEKEFLAAADRASRFLNRMSRDSD